ncbi:polyphosphate glucokinase [Arthrobacter livingstonensis]|uniref:Polyphosphate glucokinase n=1 Tax=Arthrobacter livingstonensis TaxID=670078 RepID=A0A2V5L6R7_9MICC|nr:ROK family protein [Arthrobacter livingstonensis]PYI65934.1 polyphosphate glucokinase [Arthrobacter livingstonensis]
MEKTIHNTLRIGIDIGGTAIKYGVVDTSTGILVSPIAQQPTPQPATPTAIANTLRAVMTDIQSWETAPSPLTAAGVAFPAIIRQGTACSAANISDEWIGLNVERLLSTALQRPAKVLNDADAAGLAESSHGAGKGQRGIVLVLTLGTGIGSALVVDGNLVPNLELGHLQLNGLKAETTTSALAREKEGLSWNEYSSRLQQYLSHAEFLFSPDLIIIGGGISVRHGEFLPQIRLTTPIVPAHLHNSAGVIGAAQIVG